MGLDRDSLKDGAVGPEKMTLSQRLGRYCLETFMQEPLCWVKGTATAPAGTDTTENCVYTGRYTFEYYFMGTATDAFVPTIGTDGGYTWAFTDALAQGFELNFAGLRTSHPRAFQPSSENWFARILLNITNASGADIVFGMHKVESAPVADLATLTDLAALRLLGDSSSTTASFSIVTNLNNATDVTSKALSATGLEDATAVELEVRVINRVAHFYINGVEYSNNATAAAGGQFTFDSGDYCVPFLMALETTDTSGGIKVRAFEAGPLDDRTDSTLVALLSATAWA